MIDTLGGVKRGAVGAAVCICVSGCRVSLLWGLGVWILIKADEAQLKVREGEEDGP